MGCNSCKYLKKSDRKEGECGACYYCTKYKRYVNGSSNGCENYSYDYMKSTLDKDEIYIDGTKYSSDNTSISTYIMILFILIILGLICNVFTF